jgi:hypothetical protein
MLRGMASPKGERNDRRVRAVTAFKVFVKVLPG